MRRTNHVVVKTNKYKTTTTTKQTIKNKKPFTCHQYEDETQLTKLQENGDLLSFHAFFNSLDKNRNKDENRDQDKTGTEMK